MIDPGLVAFPSQPDLVLKARVLPWIATIVVALALQRLACFLNDVSVLSGNLTQAVILFCGVIAGGVAPRAFPNAVHLKVTGRGLNVRDVFVFIHADWGDVTEPFEWRRTLLGERIVCRCRRSNFNGMGHVQFYNNFEISTSTLVDLLNVRWRSSRSDDVARDFEESSEE